MKVRQHNIRMIIRSGLLAATIAFNGAGEILAGDVSSWKECTSVTIPVGEVVRLTCSTPSLDRVTVRGTILFVAPSAVLKAASVTVEAGGLITHAGPVTNGQTPARIGIECSGLLTVVKGGRISADGCGFAGGVGQAKNDDPASAGTGRRRRVSEVLGAQRRRELRWKRRHPHRQKCLWQGWATGRSRKRRWRWQGPWCRRGRRNHSHSS